MLRSLVGSEMCIRDRSKQALLAELLLDRVRSRFCPGTYDGVRQFKFRTSTKIRNHWSGRTVHRDAILAQRDCLEAPPIRRTLVRIQGVGFRRLVDQDRCLGKGREPRLGFAACRSCLEAQSLVDGCSPRKQRKPKGKDTSTDRFCSPWLGRGIGCF